MSKRERISSVDTAWLRMDRPTNLMMIVGVLMFDGPLDFARLRRTVAARLVAPYSRFRQKALVETAGAWWEDDPDFDLDAHLHRVALPGRQDQEELLLELSKELLPHLRLFSLVFQKEARCYLKH